MANIIGIDLIKAINVLNADNIYGVDILGNDPDKISYRDADGNSIAAPWTKEEVLAEHTKLQAAYDALSEAEQNELNKTRPGPITLP